MNFNVDMKFCKSRGFLGIAYMLVSVLGFSTMGVIYRGIRETAGPGTAMLWRSLVGLIFTFCYAAVVKQSVIGKNSSMLILRGIAGAAALLLFFFSARLIDLGTATALCYIYPFVASLLSMLFLSENVGIRGWIGITTAWLGVAMIVGFRPGIGLGEVSGFASGILAGIAVHTVRALRKKGESVVAIIFWFFSIGFVMALPFAFIEDCSLGIFSSSLLSLIGIGLAATVGQVSLTRAYKDLPTRYGSPFSLLVVPLSMLGAFLFSSELPSKSALLGTLILSASLILLSNATEE
ncbi:TPA: hypothetical protein DEF17_08560 [bacterium]|nr:MAG: hypothetical protein COS94_03020 [Candidatus Hydrogenedentes bacterium CG07_land_8_20_14_0_80_42_17]HBW47960.1 hypothetical protein [bacterium]